MEKNAVKGIKILNIFPSFRGLFLNTSQCFLFVRKGWVALDLGILAGQCSPFLAPGVGWGALPCSAAHTVHQPAQVRCSVPRPRVGKASQASLLAVDLPPQPVVD